MPNINIWLGVRPPLETWTANEDRSYETARDIYAKPVSIVLVREGVVMAPQTVRLEIYRHPNKYRGMGQNVIIAEETVMILGFKNNPIVPDTDMRRGDRFRLVDQDYDIEQVFQETGDRMIGVARARE